MQSITKVKEATIVRRRPKTITRGKSRNPIVDRKQTAIKNIEPTRKALIFPPLLII